MRAIVVGLGSMGRRRIRLLQSVDGSIEVVGVDMLESRRKQAEKELGIKTISALEVACRSDAQIAFISTPPLSHASIIKECIERNLHVFTEINLVDTGYDENMALAKERNKVLFLSSTFLYRKEIQFIKKQVLNCNCPLTYTYHTGQYLPDWHPWENYKDFFVGHKETNGCRELMAIEFPWIIEVFGDIKRFDVISSRQTNLEIEFKDDYAILVEHDNGNKGLLHVDVVSRKAVRNLEVSGEYLYLTWDGTPFGLKCFDMDSKADKEIILYDTVEKRNDYSASIIEDAYKAEVVNFLDDVDGKNEPYYSFEKDKTVLTLIDSIEGRREECL